MLPSNDPDSVLVNAFCCFDPSQEPNHIQRFAETLCERFWHAFKSNKFQPNLRFDSAACQKEMVSARWPGCTRPISSNPTVTTFDGSLPVSAFRSDDC